MKSRSGTSAHETRGYDVGLVTRSRQPHADKQNVEKAGKLGCVLLLIDTNIRNFFVSRGERQLTEIFVSGTEVFSDAKMTETPYE